MEMLGLVELKQTRFYQEVFSEGKAEGQKVIARNLLKANFSPEQVAQLTGLSLVEVQQLNSLLDS
ncbi:hypothetical protein GlitD10_0344 [Gloeomargarita lithophora Alchichica-D10]|uniref:Transposase n=1 Tax=Gloeomargarita lithophora Alchichica-D10 TaxID=1188229 RepID=A0A1J0A9N5_9CYAN|nr:hypothetical protein [Gloeomargarita lithophora]APB32652.1 hypothetical protein GlitD10_0344 [Gloeomargarita lithophora Alchichica-D10]